ncbi:hypothetical protein CALVIDRAFT_554364 [Calocera viscosa TUFC12733]|uniref:DUF6593 domain-containing protein n=1 Tax=Calocera viscosa (strain TUFC12733) TaxID=1330018 RepID=A0A167NNV0_CALVF|nr:hypothetical protein CALVIDRAFT_554364 [Calocera viscosa TUFC12733]
MRLVFTSPDLANTALVNPVSHKPLYEVFSSPTNSNERFTTLRHAPTEKGKEPWEGKFVGSIEWGEGLFEDESATEGGEKREEGWIVWAKPEAPKRELGTLLRPIEGKGKLCATSPCVGEKQLTISSARVFTGYMRSDYIWTFKSFVLPHKPALLQLTPAVSPDPIVTFHPPSSRPSRCEPSPHSAQRRSFSLSRSPSKQRPQPRAEEPPTGSEEADAPHGYLEISPRAVEMLDLVVLTFLAMALSPQAQLLQAQRSLSGRMSLRSPPGSSGRRSAPGSAAISSGEATGSIPSTPDDDDDVPSPVPEDDEVISPVPVHGGPRKGWKELFAFKSPSPAIIANGFEAGMDKIRRFSFPAMGRPKVNVESGNYE